MYRVDRESVNPYHLASIAASCFEFAAFSKGGIEFCTQFFYEGIRIAPVAQLCKCLMKIVHIQIKSPNVEIRVFRTINDCYILKERIRSLWEQILSFKRSPIYKNGRI